MVQDITVTYGSESVGGATTRLIDGASPYRIISSYQTYTVEVDFIITDTLTAEIAILEEAFRKKREDLRIEFGASTRTFKESDGTGTNARAELRKRGDSADTGITRLYTLAVTVDLPADRDGDDGRLESTVELTILATDFRQVRISGIWTRTTGFLTARATFDSKIGVFITSVLGDFGGEGIWDEDNRVAAENNEKNRLTFAIDFNEVGFDQSGTLFNEPSLKNQTLDVSITTPSGDDSPASGVAVSGFITGSATYSTEVRSSLTKGTKALNDLWTSKIRPWISTNIKALIGATTVAITLDAPTFRLGVNAISASFSFVGASPNKDRLVQYSIEFTNEINTGAILIPVADPTNAFAKDVQQGTAKQFFRFTETMERVAIGFTNPYSFKQHRGGLVKDFSLGPFGMRVADLFPTHKLAKEGKSTWIRISEIERSRPSRRGDITDFFDTTIFTRDGVFERADTFTIVRTTGD